MTAEPSAANSDPQQLLIAARDLTRRVRRQQRGGWFPLLVLAVATFAAIPFDRYGHHVVTHCTSLHQGRQVCAGYSAGALWYWPAALLLTYALISWFYVYRSRQRGVGTRVRPYVIVGVVLVALVTVWALWAPDHPTFLAQSLRLGSSPPTNILNRIASPAGAIGLALLLLAWIERSWLLLAITIAYLIVVVTAAGQHSHHSASTAAFLPHVSPWAFLPHVLLCGGVLLLGGVILALTQRTPGRTTG